jgi:uncharacterized membrane protein YdbT with pleckstrin-like domain
MEQVIWQGATSHKRYLHWHILGLLLSWTVVGLLINLWAWLKVKATQYELTTERLIIKRGIFSKQIDELELYRVKDTQLEKHWPAHLFGLGDIRLLTSDMTTPELLMPGIDGAVELREDIRRCVEERREAKRVREIDYN